MATNRKNTTKKAHRFTAVDLGNGKLITPIRTEFGDMEYEVTLKAELICFETSEQAARGEAQQLDTIDEVRADYKPLEKHH